MGASLTVLVAFAGCGGTTSGASGVADPGRDLDAGNSSGGSTSPSLDGGSPTSTGGTSSGGVSSGSGGSSGAGGLLTCTAGATFWNVQSRGAAVLVPEGPGCFLQCDGDKPCPTGTLCAFVPGCLCADATQCEACYAEWLCVDEKLLACKNLTDFARQTVDESPQFLCTADADCVEASMDAACSSACSVAVSKSGAASVAAAIATANAKWCTAASTRNCPVSTVDCAPGFPACVGGRCQLTAPGDR